MISTRWQQLTWYIFHKISLNYNDLYRNEYIQFFENVKVIIPCRICRNHYIQNVSKENMKINDNINHERIFNWTIDLHNLVNKLNHKKQWDYDMARNYYEKMNFNNHFLLYFINDYIRTNFRKGPEKTNALLNMINTLPYLYPNENIRNKLIDFRQKFEINRDNLKHWLKTFLIIIKS
jgi:hypothetical protein